MLTQAWDLPKYGTLCVPVTHPGYKTTVSLTLACVCGTQALGKQVACICKLWSSVHWLWEPLKVKQKLQEKENLFSPTQNRLSAN